MGVQVSDGKFSGDCSATGGKESALGVRERGKTG